MKMGEKLNRRAQCLKQVELVGRTVYLRNKNGESFNVQTFDAGCSAMEIARAVQGFASFLGLPYLDLTEF